MAVAEKSNRVGVDLGAAGNATEIPKLSHEKNAKGEVGEQNHAGMFACGRRVMRSRILGTGGMLIFLLGGSLSLGMTVPAIAESCPETIEDCQTLIECAPFEKGDKNYRSWVNCLVFKNTTGTVATTSTGDKQTWEKYEKLKDRGGLPLQFDRALPETK